MAFNNPELLGPKLTAAIKDGDMGGARSEILFNSNKDKHRGIANRRYREAQLTDELEGAIIVYNNLTDVFTVDGQKTAPAGTPAGTPGGRVRAVLAPKEPASGAAAPVRGEPPALRTAPSLGGAK